MNNKLIFKDIKDQNKNVDGRLASLETKEYSTIYFQVGTSYLVNGQVIASGAFFETGDVRAFYGLPSYARGVFIVVEIEPAAAVHGFLVLTPGGTVQTAFYPNIHSNTVSHGGGMLMCTLPLNGTLRFSAVSVGFTVNAYMVGWWS